MPSYIEKRRRKFYAVLDIPRDVRGLVGKAGTARRFVRSLDTDSREVALRRAAPLVLQWQAEIQAARKGSGEAIEDDIRFWRQAFRASSPYSDEGEFSERDILLEALAETAEKMDKDNKGAGPEFYNRATGKTVGLTEYVDEWIGLLADTPKTKDMKRSFVLQFAKEFPTLDTIIKPEIKRWIGRQIDGGLTMSTINRQLSFIRSYWDHLISMGLVSDENQPLLGLRMGRASKRANPGSKTNPFSPAQVVAFRAAAEERGDSKLAELITLGMWTGCRIEELCSLRVEKVQDVSFEVVDAKTESGWRIVPIHPKLAPTMKRLISSSSDGYVISGLSQNKYNDRSNAIGKRFGRLKKSMGFKDRREVFHSLRKTVASSLKNAAVTEAVAADILGHDHDTMTYGLYTGDTPVPVMRKAIAKINYPEQKN